MIIQSIVIGIIFGTVWGNLFSDRYKRLSSAQSGDSKTSTWFLASTSVIRYLLLAALLITLLIKQYLSVPWWFAGFILSFWGILVTKIKPATPVAKENHEDSNF